MAITTLAGYKAARKTYLSYLMPNRSIVAINVFLASFTESVETWPGGLTNGLAATLVSIASGGKAYTKADDFFPNFSSPAAGEKLYVGASTFTSSSAVLSPTAVNNRMRLIDLYWGGTVNNQLTTVQNVTGFSSYSRANTTGEGLSLGVVTNNGTLALGAVFTIVYTNSAGVGGRTATFTLPAATGNSGQFVPVPLQSGDTGVQSIQSYQQSVANNSAGNNTIILFDEIVTMAPPVVTSPLKRFRSGADIFTNGLTEIDPNAALSFLFGHQSGTSDRRRGSIELVYG